MSIRAKTLDFHRNRRASSHAELAWRSHHLSPVFFADMQQSRFGCHVPIRHARTSRFTLLKILRMLLQILSAITTLFVLSLVVFYTLFLYGSNIMKFLGFIVIMLYMST